MNVLDLCAGLGGFSQAFKDRGHSVRTLDYEAKFGCTYTMDLHDFAKDPRAVLGDWQPDVILNGTDCTGFCVPTMGKMWHEGIHPPSPKHPTAERCLKLLTAGMDIKNELAPKHWLFENPTGMMRIIMEEMYDLQPMGRRVTPKSPTTTYCRYGETYRKPEDFWGVMPSGFQFQSPCTGHPRNGLAIKHGDNWEHLPRGTTIEVRKGALWLMHVDGREEAATESVYVEDRQGTPCHEAASRGAKTGVQGLATSERRALVPYRLSLSICVALEGTKGRTLETFGTEVARVTA